MTAEFVLIGVVPFLLSVSAAVMLVIGRYFRRLYNRAVLKLGWPELYRSLMMDKVMQ